MFLRAAPNGHAGRVDGCRGRAVFGHACGSDGTYRSLPLAAGRTALTVAAVLVILTTNTIFGQPSEQLSAGATAQPVYLIVTTRTLEPAVAALAQYRRTDGFDVVVSTQQPGEAIAALKAGGKHPAMLLLVGDDESGMEKQPWYVPAKRLRQFRWMPSRQKATYACDSAWGDLDGDGLPDIPVGRIPARDKSQVKQVVDKILAYEATPPGPSDRAVPIWAGSPCYSSEIDAMATGILLSTLSASAPVWMEPWVMSADPGHPLCGVPQEQPERWGRRLGQGGAMAIYIGHGDENSLYAMEYQRRDIRFTGDHVRQFLSNGPPAPPMLMICCLTASFAQSEPCLGELLLFAPGGPVAAIGATAQSHPLPNYFTGVRLLWAAGQGPQRLGTLWLEVGKKANEDRAMLIERLLQNVEGVVADVDLPKLRRDQMLIYELLGDPALKLRLPESQPTTPSR